jgi:hypothetical protein
MERVVAGFMLRVHRVSCLAHGGAPALFARPTQLTYGWRTSKGKACRKGAWAVGKGKVAAESTTVPTLHHHRNWTRQ